MEINTTAQTQSIPPAPSTAQHYAQPATPITFTAFTDVYGKTCSVHKTTVPVLAAWLVNSPPTAEKKFGLPLLKLAIFGDVRTAAGSLRHDANVFTVTGCELDYDGGEVSVETAFQILTAAGIEAIIYTSPSHTPEAPRWRILAPFSVPLIGTTDELRTGRARAVAKINHVLGGIVAPESFALSTAFFYGRVA